MKTKARFLQYTDKICRDENGNLLDGDILLEDKIMRFNSGLLHGDGEPAIACNDGHMEYWSNGKINRKGKPAILTIREDENGIVYEEYWENGQQL